MKVRSSLSALFCVVFFSSPLLGQKMLDIAEKAKKEFPKEKVVFSESSLTYEFSYDRVSGATAMQKVREKIITLDKNQKFTCPIFYADKISKITYLNTGYKAGRYKDVPYSANGIFLDDIKVSYGDYDIQPYSGHAVFEANLQYNDLKYVTTAYFTNYFCALKRVITFVIPNDFDIDLIPFNFKGYDIQVSKSRDKNDSIITYTLNNVDKFSEDDDLPGRSYIYPHILIQIKGYKHKGVYHKIFQSTDDLYAWYKKLASNIDNKKDELVPVVKKLIADKTTDKEKIESIFYWVQDNIRYIAFENGIAGYKPASCQEVYEKRYGDCKGMANITKEMLKIAGFDARLGWLGTRHIAYNYSIPSLAVDNHMICVLVQNGNYSYLDATEKYSRIGEYAERIQGKTVMIEDGDNYILKKIPSVPYTHNLEKYELNLKMDSDYTLNGNIKATFLGEAKVQMMNLLDAMPVKEQPYFLRQVLSLQNSHLSFGDIAVLQPNRKKDYVFSTSIGIPNNVNIFGNDCYVYLDPLKIFADEGTNKDRKYPLWFSYKRRVNVNITFTIPNGYTVSSLPDPLSVKTDEYIFRLNYKVDGNRIIYHFNGAIPHAEVASNSLGDWNKSIKLLKDAYEQPIILKKK